MAFIAVKNFNALHAMLDEYFKSRSVNTDTTKVGEARHEARYFGTKEGISACIGHVLTQQRIVDFPLLDRWEMVMHWEVEDALKSFVPEFPAPNSEDHVKLIEQAFNRLMELKAGDANFQGNYARLRRDKIMDGSVSMDLATPEDKEYFRSRAKKLQEEAERMAGFVRDN